MGNLVNPSIQEVHRKYRRQAVQELINLEKTLKGAHMTSLAIRINGEDRVVQADWLKLVAEYLRMGCPDGG